MDGTAQPMPLRWHSRSLHPGITGKSPQDRASQLQQHASTGIPLKHHLCRQRSAIIWSEPPRLSIPGQLARRQSLVSPDPPCGTDRQSPGKPHRHGSRNRNTEAPSRQQTDQCSEHGKDSDDAVAPNKTPHRDKHGWGAAHGANSRDQMRLNTKVPLVPPKPKLFLTATSILRSRAVLAQ